MDPSGNPPKLRIGGGPNHSWSCPDGETNQDGTKRSESWFGQRGFGTAGWSEATRTHRIFRAIPPSTHTGGGNFQPTNGSTDFLGCISKIVAELFEVSSSDLKLGKKKQTGGRSLRSLFRRARSAR